MMRTLAASCLNVLLIGAAVTHVEGAEQCIVAIADGWDSSKGRLQRFERDKGKWQSVGEPVPVLFGKSGLAWGIGLHPPRRDGPEKVERDKRAPAGVFRIGRVYTYDAALPKGSDFPFLQVTEVDAWVDDPANPHYNRHIRIDAANPPEWFEKQKMRHGDFAYRWLVEIRHNSDPPQAGKGSAIFFHIRRGPDRTSAGCTTMAEGDLVEIIRWLRESGRPRYALLTAGEYEKQWRDWDLPPPKIASALLN